MGPDEAGTSVDNVPLVDLRIAEESLREGIREGIAECIRESRFRKGPAHERFAADFARFLGEGSVVPCANGTDAIMIAILSLLGRGDGTAEIITVANTFFGTVEAIINAGYRPVFVDVDDHHLMDVTKLKSAITRNTVAVIPVHLYGQMVPMDAVSEVAREADVRVIEDAAQAHGALWKGRPPGHWGDAACYSFYPSKNLGAYGDGGAIVARDPGLAQRAALFAEHGIGTGGRHEIVGYNSRLDGIQAEVLLRKLPYLTGWNESRRIAAGRYDRLLANIGGVRTPLVRPDATVVFHLYVVQVENRAWMLRELNARGIGAAIHYHPPLHCQPALSDLGVEPGSLPVTERLSRQILSLPMFPSISWRQISRVVDTIAELSDAEKKRSPAAETA